MINIRFTTTRFLHAALTKQIYERLAGYIGEPIDEITPAVTQDLLEMIEELGDQRTPWREQMSFASTPRTLLEDNTL